MRNYLWQSCCERMPRFYRRRSRASRQRQRSLPSFKPRLEALEDRVVPTISITGPSAVTPGTQVTYTLDYTPTNFANGDTNVTIQATLPTGFKALTAIALPNFPGGPTNPDNFSIPGSSSIEGASVVTFTNTTPKSVAALSADTFQIIALAPSSLVFPPAPATVTETSTQDTAMVPSGVLTAQTTVPTVTPVADLAVAQVGPTSVTAGTDALYTITVTNTGPSDSQNVTLTDLLTNPNGGAVPGIDLANTKQLSGPDNFTYNPSTHSFTATTVGSGSSDVIQVAVAVPANFVVTNPANAAIWSTASLSSSTTLDPSTPDTATVKTGVTASANLSVTTVGPPTITAGNEATYTVTVTNNGPSTAQNVTLTEVLTGAGLSFDSTVTAPLTNPDGFGALTLVTPNSQSATFSAATVASGSSDTFRVVVRTTSDAGDNGTSFSTAASVNSSTSDPVSTDNTATASTTLTNSANLSIVETLAPPGVSPIVEGTPLTYNLLLTNNGPSDAQNVEVNFTLPAQLNSIAPIATLTNPGTGQTITGVQSGNVLTFTIPTLSGSAGKNSFSGTITVQGVEKGTATSWATVTSSTPNSNAANNTSKVATAVLEGKTVLRTINLDGTEFSTLNGVPVASFSHANGLEPASAFTAVINWGDGSTSLGTVSQPGGTGAAYIVQGSHDYLGKGNYRVTVTVSDNENVVSAGSTAAIGDTSIPIGTFLLPMTSHIQEVMEALFQAPLSPTQLNGLDLTLLVAEFSMVNQMLSHGTDPSTAFSVTQFVGLNLFDLYAEFVNGHGTPLNDAVTNITTGLLIIGSNM